MDHATRHFRLLPALFLLLPACVSVHPTHVFDPGGVPPAPDYSSMDNWAAHPEKADPADRTPCQEVLSRQDEAEIDVFFLHPTTYTGARKGERGWNAAVDDIAVNQKTDSTTILYQASIFNGAGRVFAPRYRQAHLHAFFTKDKKSAAEALDTAYADVCAAFDYYLTHWNQGRPFILAGHSQGARQGMYLVRDRIEGTSLEKQLVAAYLVGWPVKQDFFQKIKPCETPEQTGCFCSWRTYERKYALKKAHETDVVCTNPLAWNTREGAYSDKSLNRGAVLRTFCVTYPALCDAEVYKGVLLCSKPKFPGSIFFRRKNYHVGDLNLYYFNVRENAALRAEAFLR
ncbi:MAG: DUF3089 domain-containing protein [Saprospiraceae bacterium]